MNRDVWGIYEEVRIPFTSPSWNFASVYSFEVDFAEREEWYSNNTSTVLQPFAPAAHTRYNAQKPKVSVRWQPIDPKYVGAVTLRGSYTEAFHAPTLSELRRRARKASLSFQIHLLKPIPWVSGLTPKSRSGFLEIRSYIRKSLMNGLTALFTVRSGLKG